MSAENLLQANISTTNSLLLIPNRRPTDNPISQAAVPKTDIGNNADHLQVPIW